MPIVQSDTEQSVFELKFIYPQELVLAAGWPSKRSRKSTVFANMDRYTWYWTSKVLPLM
jgi:hypothetical protein